MVLPALRFAPAPGRRRAGYAASARSRRPPVRWVLYGVGRSSTRRAGSVRLDLALPGRANQSNAVVALAVAEVFGVDAGARRSGGLRDVTSVAGRYTTR